MNEKILIPVSIIFAGIILSIAIFASKPAEVVVQAKEDQSYKDGIDYEKIPKVTADDHIENTTFEEANSFIIEYSDLECPACLAYDQSTHEGLLEFYKDNRKVGIVFRHFPLAPIHPEAIKLAVAAECVAEVSGNDKFFEFTDAIYKAQNKPSQLAEIPNIIKDLEIENEEFNKCFVKPENTTKISQEFETLRDANLLGTPAIFVQDRFGKIRWIRKDSTLEKPQAFFYKIIDAIRIGVDNLTQTK